MGRGKSPPAGALTVLATIDVPCLPPLLAFRLFKAQDTPQRTIIAVRLCVINETRLVQFLLVALRQFGPLRLRYRLPRIFPFGRVAFLGRRRLDGCVETHVPRFHAFQVGSRPEGFVRRKVLDLLPEVLLDAVRAGQHFVLFVGPGNHVAVDDEILRPVRRRQRRVVRGVAAFFVMKSKLLPQAYSNCRLERIRRISP